MFESPAQILDDRFLSLAHLFILEFSAYGKLLSLRPGDKDFWGWNQKNIPQFNLETHLLNVNRIPIEEFRHISESGTPFSHLLSWMSPDGKLSPPLPTYWHFDTEKEHAQNITAIVSASSAYPRTTNYFELKQRYLQALFVPGFIHNVNGLLGTMVGRAELLHTKYPEVSDAEQIVRIGNRLRSLVENVRFKIAHENYKGKIQIHLNRFLREEIEFLSCDLFFKHQIKITEELQTAIPEFQAHYDSLSGIIGECYQFCRQLMNPQNEYGLTVQSFTSDQRIGFEWRFDGEFDPNNIPELSFPATLSGMYHDFLHANLPGIDTFFLANCIASTEGELQLSCASDKAVFRYIFPLPTT